MDGKTVESSAYYEKGDLFGAIEVLEKKHRKFRAVTLVETTVIVVGFPILQFVFDKFPGFKEKFELIVDEDRKNIRAI